MEFFMKYGLLGLLCRALFVLSLIFVGAWVLFKLVMAIWPILLAIALAWGIYMLARRKAKA